MTLSIIAEVNDARLIGLRDYLDSGTLSASILIYNGTRPSLPTDAATGTLLVQIHLTDPCGTLVAHQLQLTEAALAQVTTSGTATWARIVKDGESTGIDGDVSDLTGSGDIKISNTMLWVGGYVSLVSAVLV
jgi:hypothetical protein